MGLNDTPSGERIHIGFFGCRNAGKSSLINAVTGQDLAIVSDVRGTTTDPVYKAMELLPMGPVMLIDTPGIDDEGSLGELRIKKTRQVLNKTDVAVLVVDAPAAGETNALTAAGEPTAAADRPLTSAGAFAAAEEALNEAEQGLIRLFREKNMPWLLVFNKSDQLAGKELKSAGEIPDGQILYVSAVTGDGIYELKEKIASMAARTGEKKLIADLIQPGDVIVLVTPIDKAAPKGRLILPQQQTIRDILDAGAIAAVARETELRGMLKKLSVRPALVVTDSQVFGKVAAEVPEDVPLTSFSILMARYKGLLDAAAKGAAAVERLKDGDMVLISEGCTHHRQCEDIGTVKLPRWIREYTGKELVFEFSSGSGFPEELEKYAMIVHCGGCMLGEREIGYRMKCAVDQGVPITNYGVMIAYLKGILKRSLQIFPDLQL